MVTFPRPANGNIRGVHWSASTNHASPLSNWPYWLDQLQAMGIGWVKLLDGGGSSLKMCQLLLEAGIIPIVRMYRGEPNPGTIPGSHLAAISLLVDNGVRYFEPNNEPNLRTEWDFTSWANATWQARVEMVMASWVADASAILAVGGLPAFPALAQCAEKMTDEGIGSIPFYVEAFRLLKEKHAVAAHDLFANGAWIAVHTATLNHPLDYPYDPVNLQGNPNATTMTDDCCLRGYEVPAKLVKDAFGLSPPVLSTEGGVLMPKNGSEQLDTRYPAVTYDTQGRLTVEMFDWLVKNAPQVYAMCPWLIANERMGHDNTAWTNDAWFHKDGERPVVAAMKAAKPEPAPLPVPTPVPAPVEAPMDAQIREAAWTAVGFAYNPAAKFQEYAGANDLGVPLTAEFTVGDQTVQGYALGIVCCKTGDWDNVRHIPWSKKTQTRSARRASRRRSTG